MLGTMSNKMPISQGFQIPPQDKVNLTGHTILQIVPQLETGGAEVTTVEMAEAIVKAGGRALVVSEGGALAQQITASGGDIMHMPVASKNPLTMWRNANRLAALIKNENISLA